LLAQLGYRLIAGNGPASKARAVGRRKQELPKTLRCPKCDRRFSRQMHVARHMSAMHGGQKKAKRRRPTTAKKSKMSVTRRTTSGSGVPLLSHHAVSR
jgi:uncharacterized C2H2 Zn-finger protein